MKDQTPYAQGYADQMRGVAANPFTAGSAEAAEWDRGFSVAASFQTDYWSE